MVNEDTAPSSAIIKSCNSFSVSYAAPAPFVRSDTTDLTYAVVATCVVFVEEAAVGAVGIPVNAGEARGALRLSPAAVAIILSEDAVPM